MPANYNVWKTTSQTSGDVNVDKKIMHYDVHFRRREYARYDKGHGEIISKSSPIFSVLH